MPAAQPNPSQPPQSYDAIIIGAGVIGCAIAYSMAQEGLKTLNVDTLPAAGYGSTSSSAAVIRTYYSTLDGTAMAYDGYHDWKHWPQTLGAASDDGLARFVQTGTLIMKTASNNLDNVLKHADTLGITYELWSPEQILKSMPGYDLACFSPVRTMEDDAFGTPTGGRIEGGVFFHAGGYVDDPQIAARNLKDAAAMLGAEFLFNTRVSRIPMEDNRVAGV
ncbi:MAG: FAD-dependent oxidoreductase, partial [Pseudomonadota bacterium]